MIWMLQDDGEHHQGDWSQVQGHFNHTAANHTKRNNLQNSNHRKKSTKRVTLLTDIPPAEGSDTGSDYTDLTVRVEDTVITTIPPWREPVYNFSSITESSGAASSLSSRRKTKATTTRKQIKIEPTKYTYEHTSSFDDSGISDFSNPQSPRLDTSRGSLREVHTLYPGHSTTNMTTTVNGHHSTTGGKPVEKKFLKKVQRELEEQRTKWEGEVDMLSDSFFSKASIPASGKATQQGENSYVDTAGGSPLFKAFVDMSQYPKRGISVNVDNLTNKVVITANQENGLGNVTRTFTQKVALPRFADHQRLTSHLSKKGILKIEVPLLFYFQRPDDAKERDRKAKSFVYQVEDGKNGAKVLEILVNTGSEYRAKELKVLVQEDNKLVIIGEKEMTDGLTGRRNVQQKLIKQYSLPGYADVDHITSKLGKDGRLQVNVPMLKR